MLNLRFFPLVLKQVLRHRTRSTLTIAGVAVAMFVFCGVRALQRGADLATRGSTAESLLVVYRKDRYCPYTSRLPQAYADRIRAVPGVVSLVPMQVVLSNCRTSLDVITFRGVPAEEFRRMYAPDLQLAAGSLDAWMQRSDAALVGETLARRRGLRLGDRFASAGVTVSVAGILRSAEPQHQNVAYTHLDFLQRAAQRGGVGVVTQFSVRVADPTQLDPVARAIDAEFAGDPDPTQTRPAAAFFAQAAKDVLEIVAFTRWLGWACLVAVAALVGNAIVLAVQDRVVEHAILQTLGFGGGLLARLVVAESAILGLAGGLCGALPAVAVLRWGQFSLSVEGQSIPIQAGADLLIMGMLLCVGLGVLAGVVPAYQVSRREIAECFRAV